MNRPSSTTDQEPIERTGRALTRIANDTVALYKRLYGRGPTRARAVSAGDDIVLVTMLETHSRGERTLAASGQGALTRASRDAIGDAHLAEFRALVEDVLGREVSHVVIGHDPTDDVTAVVTYLRPLGSSQGGGARSA